jgi:hypothetical protein
VAASQLKVLLDELTSILSEMGALEGSVPEGEAMPEDGVAKMESLSQRAEKVKGQISFWEARTEKEKEYRSILNRCAPVYADQAAATAAAATAAQSASALAGVDQRSAHPGNRGYAIPKAYGKLRAFEGADAEQRALRSGMFLKGFCFGDAEARRWCHDNGVEHRAQAGGINETGGVLVPPEFSAEVIRLVEQYGRFPAQAQNVTMNSDQMFIPRRTGGLTAQPIGENSQPNDSNINYNSVELVAKLWGIGNRLPNSLIEDSPVKLADELAIESAYAFAKAYDDAGFIGDGSLASYHGTTGLTVKIDDGKHTKSVVTSGAGRNTFDTLTMPDFTSLVARLPVYARRRAAFYISPVGWGAGMLRLLAQTGGNTGTNVAEGFPEKFLGYPVYLCHSMVGDLTGTANKIGVLFGDLSMAASFGIRREVTLKTSTERYIEFDQTYTFASARVAINVHDLGDNNKAGPIVALKFAA